MNIAISPQDAEKIYAMLMIQHQDGSVSLQGVTFGAAICEAVDAVCAADPCCKIRVFERSHDRGYFFENEDRMW